MTQSSSFNQIIEVFTDGGSRGNPGIAGAGIYIKGLGEDKYISIYLGEKTNNEAEYLALLGAINYILKQTIKKTKKIDLSGSQIVFKLDSMLVVKQINDEWNIKEKRMQAYVNEIKQHLEKIGGEAVFKHIKRELNSVADELANQAMDLGKTLKL